MLNSCREFWKRVVPSETLLSTVIIAVLVGLGHVDGWVGVMMIGLMEMVDLPTLVKALHKAD